MSDQKNWYAVRIYTASNVIRRYFASIGAELFVPKMGDIPVIRSLALVKCTREEILKAKAEWYMQMMVYRDPEGIAPQPVSDHDMFVFMRALHVGGQDLIPIEVTDRKILEGQRVRVTDGPFKDVEGVVKRFKGDRRLIVSVAGIVAVATVNIPMRMLEPVDGTPAQGQ